MKRELGVVTLGGGERPERTPEQQALAEQALTILREEVERLAAQRAEYETERAHGAPGGKVGVADDAATRLEGAARFALRMGLVTPAEAREIFAEAGKRGLVERGGHE